MISVATTGGTKRKERDFDTDEEETNINVVVRCRGRNEREVRENSGVVLSTDGVRGKSLELSMGPSALSNKTYHFDKVFSSAADQSMIYDEVVTPILDEVSLILASLNPIEQSNPNYQS
jgi:kinesin family protein 11